MDQNTPPNTPCAVDIRAMIRRLRWVMIGVILFDLMMTYTGQPARYWADPSAVHEGNEWFRLTMAQGWRVSMVIDFVYLAGCFALVSLTPWRIGAAVMFALLFGHYFGGSSWLVFRWGLGAQSFILYGVFLGLVITWVGLRKVVERA